MRIHNDIAVIEGPADVLSAGHPALFAVHSKHFASVDHYIAFQKAQLFRDMVAAHRIWSASDPLEISSLSRTIKAYDAPNWARHRAVITETGHLAKFEQNPDMAQALLDTGSTRLAVANSVNGQRGLTLSATDPAIFDLGRWVGLNIEGAALERTRSTLQRRLKQVEPNWDTSPEPVSTRHKIDRCSSWHAGFCHVVPREHWLTDLQAMPADDLKAEIKKYMEEVRYGNPDVDPECNVFVGWVEQSFGLRMG